MDATLLEWVVYLGGPSIVAYLLSLHAKQHQADIENASLTAKLEALQSSHDKLHTLVTERNYQFEAKLDRLSENKADK